jgi:hypothetical protein
MGYLVSSLQDPWNEGGFMVPFMNGKTEAQEGPLAQVTKMQSDCTTPLQCLFTQHWMCLVKFYSTGYFCIPTTCQVLR